jgi:hypothetical protein
MLPRLIRIGNLGFVEDGEIRFFLPNYPSIRGDEFIFELTWAHLLRLENAEIVDVIRGVHLIELAYRESTRNDFGFGSTNPSFALLTEFVEVDEVSARALWEWIKLTGGNYFIPRCPLQTQAEVAKLRDAKQMEMDAIRDEKKLAREALRNVKERLHKQKICNDRNETEVVSKLSTIELLVVAERPIYFFARSLQFLASTSLSADEKAAARSLVGRLEKGEPSRERLRLIRLLKGICE